MMRRENFLRGTLVGLFIAVIGHLALSTTFAQEDEDEIGLHLSGAYLNIHDPVIIKQDDTYYVFSTGIGIPVKRSSDMLGWENAPGETVFNPMPGEAFAYVPNATNIWAPDISYFNDQYHLYYAISTFGSSHSAIGLATNKTLHYDDEDFEWVDHGIVVKTDTSDNYNAIDANLVLDTDDTPWLVFGSHWSGIKMIRLDYETGKPSTEDYTLYSLASRAVPPRAIEAPFIIHRGDYYYLFVSFDQCCQRTSSTYNVRVGRSEEITGPYADRNGVPMMEDGGTQITFPTKRYRGPGHNAIYREEDRDYIVYHAYDADLGGLSVLRIAPLEWDDEGWPYVPGMEAEE